MEPKGSRLFESLVAQTTEALENRGLSVLPTAVASVIDGLIEPAVQRAGISRAEALRLLVPEQVADLIVRAQREEPQASVRPLRENKGGADVPSTAAGQLIMALGQAAKMAVTNGDRETTVHASDLLSEFGASLVGAKTPARLSLERGVLAETAQILDRVAGNFEDAGWSTCPCGEEHGQQALDLGLPRVFRADAEMARQVLLTELAKGD
jgi:nucleotide-binding universal stress UspA family protein